MESNDSDMEDSATKPKRKGTQDSSVLTEKSWTDQNKTVSNTSSELQCITLNSKSTSDDQKSASYLEKLCYTSHLNMKKDRSQKKSSKIDTKKKINLSNDVSEMSTSGKNGAQDLKHLDTVSSRKEWNTDATYLQCGVVSSSGRKIKRPAHWSSMSLSSRPKVNKTTHYADNSTSTETLLKLRTDIHFDETIKNTTITSFSAKIDDVSGSSDHGQLLKLFNARVRVKRLSSAEIDAYTNQLTSSKQDEHKVDFDKDRSIFEENCPDFKIEICSNNILPEGDKQSDFRPSSTSISKGQKKKMFTKRGEIVGQAKEIYSELITENAKSSYVPAYSDHCYGNSVTDMISRNLNVGQKRTNPCNLDVNFHQARTEKKAKIDFKSNQFSQPIRRSNRRTNFSMKLKMAKVGDDCDNDGRVSWQHIFKKAGKIGQSGLDELVATGRKETQIFKETTEESIKNRHQQQPFNVDVETKSEHEEESARRVYQCSQCDVTFENYRHLYLHVTSHHSAERCFICFTCGLGVGCSQGQKTNLRSQHNEKHKNEEFPFICTVHEKGFKYKELFEQHIENYHANQSLLTCDICEKHITSYRFFVDHYQTCFREKYKIDDRSITDKQKTITSPYTSNENKKDKVHLTDLIMQLFNMDDLRSFGLNIDKPNSSLIEGLFHCENCEENFIDYTHLYVHLKVHYGDCPSICLQCGKGINGRQYLVNRWKKNHSVRHEDNPDSLPFSCNTCKSRFAKVDFMVWHKREHNGKGLYVCQSCGKDFLRGSNFSYHLKQTRKCFEQLISIGYSFIKNNDVTSSTGTEESMEKDRKTQHDNSRTYVKGASSKIRPLSNEVQMTQNIQRYLQKERFFKLKRKFDKARNILVPARIKKMDVLSTELKSHIIPSLEQNHKCNICKRIFKSEHRLTLHINKNHNGKVLKMMFACKICGECFVCINDQRNHTRLHHLNIRYSCKICGKQLSNSGVLKMHMEKQHQNEVCSDSPAFTTQLYSTQIPVHQGESEAYSQKYFLQYPAKKSVEGSQGTETKIKTEKAETEYNLESNKGVITADDFCICECCGLLHESKSLLNLHIKKSHSGNEWKCNLCESAVFTSSRNATKHRIQFHKNILSNFLCFGAPTVKKGESSNSKTQSSEEDSVVQIGPLQQNEKEVPVSQIHTESKQYTLPINWTQLRRSSTLPMNDEGELAQVDKEINSADIDNHVKVQLINYSSNLSEGGVYTATRLELSPVKKIMSFNSITSTSTTESLENSQNSENDVESFGQDMTFKEDCDEINRMISEDHGNAGIHVSADDIAEKAEIIVDNAERLETSSYDDHEMAKRNDLSRHDIEMGTSDNIEMGTSDNIETGTSDNIETGTSVKIETDTSDNMETCTRDNGTEISLYDNIIKAETDDNINMMEINGNHHVGIISQLRQFCGKDFTQNEIDIASSLLNLDSPIRPATPVKENSLLQKSKPLNVLTLIKQDCQSNMDVLIDNKTSGGCIAVEDVKEEIVVETTARNIFKGHSEYKLNVETNSINIEKKDGVENEVASESSAFKPVTINKNSNGTNYSIMDSFTFQNEMAQINNDNQNELQTNKSDVKAGEEETILVTPEDVIRRKVESAKVIQNVDVPRKLAEPYHAIINMPDDKDEIQNVIINLPKYVNTVDLSVANMDIDDEDVYLLFYI